MLVSVATVLQSERLRKLKLPTYMTMDNELMLAHSSLSKLGRGRVAVVVCSANRCYYCLVAHGQAVRRLSGDAEFGEMMVMNYRVAKRDVRQRTMLDFAWKLTRAPNDVGDADRAALRAAGLSAEDIFDLAETVGFFNMSNRMAYALDMMPNHEYHRLDR